jgi:hypothetical protein
VPAGTVVSGNQASELGVYVKQSGFYYHAQSISATVTRNVFFNIPRAGINVLCSPSSCARSLAAPY